LAVLKARLAALAGPDDVNMDDPQGLRARAERLADRRALVEAIARLEVQIAQADGVQVSK
jgi:hypothetical protein